MISVRIVSILLAIALILLGAAFVITRRALASRALARHERAFAIAELELRLCELQQRSHETALLADELRSWAIRDSLTGLFNRRYFEETVACDVQRRTRTGGAVSVVVIDVDWFKRINDTFGHAGGDALLRQLAQLLQTACGPDDVICRYGGEEFVMVLPNTCADTARIRAERLRAQVLLFHPQLEGQPLGDISISAGVAASPDQGRSLDTLFAAADRALYAAKNSGRNRVVTASTLQFAIRDAA